MRIREFGRKAARKAELCPKTARSAHEPGIVAHNRITAYNEDGGFMRFLIAVLAVAGVIVSSFALREHYRTEPSPCSINERWDCGAVNHIPFAEVGGILQQLTGQPASE